MRLACDFETDNLLKDCTRIWCGAIIDLDSDYEESFVSDGNGRIGQMLDILEDPNNELVFHNGYGFDLQVLKKLYNVDLIGTRPIHDTFLLSQVMFGDLKQRDYAAFQIPPKYIGSHSLAAWGHRLQCYKGEYTKGFHALNQEMIDYNLQDVRVTKALYLYLESIKPDKMLDESCMQTEYDIAPILARQQERGVLFDREKAEKLYATLISEKVRIRQDLQKVFKPRVVSLGEVVPKVTNSKYHISKGAVYTRIKFEEYNPSSRKQSIDRLVKEFGWNPEEFTDKGNPEFDEEIIDALPFKELQPLKDYFMIDKRIGQLAQGTNAWLKLVKEDSRIYGSILQSGTITRRSAHFKPNLAQCPSTDKPYGTECRSLFTVPEGKVMIGCDADALEMRTLASYLHRIDGGKFIETILKGKKEEGTDMHTLNAYAYGIDQYNGARDCSKVIFYGSIYGAKNPKIGLILQQFGIDLTQYVPDYDKQMKQIRAWNEKKQTNFTDKYLECLIAGKHAMTLYGERMPELPQLIKEVQDRWKKNGYLKAIDGGKLFPRSEHSAFNILNQSCGAIIMKKALKIADDNLQKHLVVGRDYEFILNVHDEWELEVVDNQEIISIIVNILPDAIKQAGEFFKLPCPFTGQAQIGKNWSEVH